MLGTKIRSWMEAHIVRPRKKQHRKDGTTKKRSENGISKDATELSQASLPEAHITATTTSTTTTDTTMVNGRLTKTVLNSEQVRTQYQRQQNSNNLSSPESAYSTGYSTDGTSPGTSFPAAAPAPEYYINIRTGTRYFHSSTSDVPLRLLLPAASTQQTSTTTTSTTVTACVESNPSGGCVASPALTSPRQRNRIRTNPWVTTSNAACNCSPMHAAISSRQPVLSQPQIPAPGVRPAVLAATASPVRRKWSCADKKQRCMKCGACSRFEAFSSSSSSSLSVSSVHRAVTRPSLASDDEDDRTLNEMMGKYDESYVYEKETDILSDSDPTDCDEEYDDTDAEAGRDGGDEQDPLTDEDDFDFIDNGSLEFNVTDDSNKGFVNMGHCTYHSFQDDPVINRRRESGKMTALRRSTGGMSGSSGTPTTSRRRRPSERRNRHASSKKRRERHIFGSPFNEQLCGGASGSAGGPIALPVLPPIPARTRVFTGHLDGSRSAGATPVSVRRRRAALADQASSWLSRSIDKQRRNSVSHTRHCPRLQVDGKLLEVDKEADKKYRELIIEAEHILMAMRTSSPPVSGSPARRATIGPANKRVELLRNEECGGGGGGVVGGGSVNSGAVDVLKSTQITCLSGADVGAVKFSPKKNHITNFINNNAPLVSPVASSPGIPGGVRGKLAESPRRAPLVAFRPAHTDLHKHCPQSEPVKRKIYAPIDTISAGTASAATTSTVDRALLFSAVDTGSCSSDGMHASAGNPVFQRQKLFQTITSLKKNLENQSETLRHAYHFGSSQRLSVAVQQL